ncbi:RNA-guided endonuclease IscB [Clostridium tyrobutyricum]|jgi:hypothetical protein|uniref:RNA-guided endonuclease IscB n=1 Tax=Clostridium tyrobutyricum TaxID=1519 RepID=UPI000E817F72|nr:RNA-guided endonuclease IscB [Clostridium tyrobutyricum]HBF77792.1 paclitaxel/taxanoid biosynthesis susceptibility protein TS1 [Clostridiaceae bacterium]HBG39074.1 paclitaxel/taxanoid biosynthesis susceptibility protein TS1 [Clostridiaceae bacterium]
MVYVLNKDGKPLMPTNRCAKVRILLKEKKARVVKSKPFTIQLLYETKNYTQPITLGIDSGYLNIGFSAVTNNKELISGEVALLQGMSERLKEKRMYRKQRRSRLRHREPRFNNRKHKEGWLAPSIQHKLDSHVRFIEGLKSILPITNTIIEVANFDIQKIKDPSIVGKDYQNGEQKDFYNTREYIFYRDHYTCQICKRTDIPLQVHHIGYWKGNRSNRPENLATLCVKCHTPKNHEKGHILYNWKPKLNGYKDATFMSIVRWRLVDILNCQYTYGYITKSQRIKLNLPKTHYNDAFCIAGGKTQERIEPIFYKQVRRNNRSLEKFYDAKYIDIRTNEKVKSQELFSGRRTRNKNNNTENLHKYRREKVSAGRKTIRKKRYFYQPNDLVKYNNKICVVKGTFNKGAWVMLKLGKGKSVKTGDLKPYKFSKGFALV